MTTTVVRRVYADVDGRQVHYRHSGDPDKPVLVLLHQRPAARRCTSS